MKKKPLTICIRCHKSPDLIRDTIESIRKYCSKENYHLMLAIDNKPNLAKKFDIPCYVSTTPCGWGAGLFKLLCESIEFAEGYFEYGHFVSIDYDTLFIQDGVDEALLEHLDDQNIGLVGNAEKSNTRWKKAFDFSKREIEDVYGPAPEGYVQGEGVYGGMFMITRLMIDRMKQYGYLRSPRKNLDSHCRVADDHMTPRVCKSLGMTVRQLDKRFQILWDLTTDPFELLGRGVIAFHPTKVKPLSKDIALERKVRRFYKDKRDKKC